METQRLIQLLSKDARLTAPRFGKTFALAIALAVAAAAVGFAILLNPRADFLSAIQTPRFAFKFLLTLSLTAVATLALFSAESPGARSRWLLLLIVPAFVVLSIGVEIAMLPEADWAARWIGKNARYCLMYIPLIGAIPLVVLLFAMRHGAPDEPKSAGAFAGLVAGGIAATFYASHCPDDSPLFVATWYTIGVAILVIAGSAIGNRMLRW